MHVLQTRSHLQEALWIRGCFLSPPTSFRWSGEGVLGGFILFNLRLIGRRGGVISKPHHPSTIQGCHSAAAPPQLRLQPLPRLGATWGLTWAPGAGLGRRVHDRQRGIVAGPGREGLP